MTRNMSMLLMIFGTLIFAASIFAAAFFSNQQAIKQRETRLQKIEYRLDSMQTRVDQIAFAKGVVSE